MPENDILEIDSNYEMNSKRTKIKYYSYIPYYGNINAINSNDDYFYRRKIKSPYKN